MQGSINTIIKGLAMGGQCFHRSCQSSPLGDRPEGEFRQLLDQATHQQTEAITPHLTEITLLLKLGIEVPNERRQQCTGNQQPPWETDVEQSSVSQDGLLPLGIQLLKSFAFPSNGQYHPCLLRKEKSWIVIQHRSKKKYALLVIVKFHSKKRVSHSENWPMIWQYSLLDC